MKPTRKLRRGSFVMRVSGGNPSGMGEPGGQGKGGAANDHDLVHPGGGGNDPDGGPAAKR